MNSVVKSLVVAASLLLGAMTMPTAQASPICESNGELCKKFNLPIYEWSDPEQMPRATIVALHGLTFYAAAYDDLARHLTERGYRFIAIDMRGFGRWRDEHDKFAGDGLVHFTQTKEDTLKLLTALKKEQPDQKLFAMGESLGANLALDLVSNNPDITDGVILGSLCYKAKVHPKPRWAIDVVKGLKSPNKPLNLTPYITPYLSHSKQLTKSCMQDQKICRRLSPVELIKAQKTNSWALLNVDKLPEDYPVLVVAGELDGVFKTKMLPELFERFSTKKLDVNIFPDKGHLLLEHQKVMPEIATIFDRWLSTQTQPEQVVQLSENQRPEQDRVHLP